MIYYFLPDTGIFGGVKVAGRFVETLGELGVRAVLVTPDGRAPQWFRCRAAVLAEREAIARLTPADWKMITWPPDYRRLRSLAGRLICHCQGTDARMDEIFADETVPILTCWTQASRYVRDRHSREPIEVGISTSLDFWFDGSRKFDNLVGYMPRRGVGIARRAIRSCRDLDFVPIDGLDERTVSRIMKRCGIFLATAVREEFGLPALEAMASGCLVVSVPVKGGREYLRDGDNCIVADPETVVDRLGSITRPAHIERRARLRSRGVATALRYRPAVQRARLRRLLDADLRALAS